MCNCEIDGHMRYDSLIGVLSFGYFCFQHNCKSCYVNVSYTRPPFPGLQSTLFWFLVVCILLTPYYKVPSDFPLNMPDGPTLLKSLGYLIH